MFCHVLRSLEEFKVPTVNANGGGPNISRQEETIGDARCDPRQICA